MGPAGGNGRALLWFNVCRPNDPRPLLGSLARNFPNSAGELGGSTNPPRSTRRALTAESEIAKLISYLHVAGQDQCRCDRLFSAVVTGAGTTRKWRQRLAYTRFGGKAEIKTAR